MDYILQMEKLYKFFEFTLDLSEIRAMYKIKHRFNDDLNLFGSFIKDFLTIKNYGVTSDDSSLYDDFIIWFEQVSYKKNTIVNELARYSEYYRMIVFEEAEDEKILSAISTVNACFAIECYPNLMEILNKYYNLKIDANTIYKMLESLIDIILKRFEDFSGSILDYKDLEEQIEPVKIERAVI